ncbi:MAG TPA: radical SAM protein [Bacteroidota bacterium]|nr:radical SAM protein [Bacteroidota bacterium]
MSRADILFTHSYFLRFDPKEFRAMTPYPPLGTLYAAALARSLGLRPALFDSMLAADEAEIVPLLRALKPRVLAIYDDDFNYLTKMCLSRMREAAYALVRSGRENGCTVIVHGSDAADHAEEYIARGADYVIRGEGEGPLEGLLRALFGGAGDPRAVQGIVFREGAGVDRTAPHAAAKNLDALPLPAWDLIDADRYRDLWVKRHGYFSLNMVTTRGCPFHCNWCAKPIYGQTYVSRSPAHVVDELLHLRATLRPDHIWFCDDIFGLKPGWIEEFSAEVERRGARTPYKCLARVDLLLKGDVIRHLAASGCTSVWVGAESGSQKILDAMEKGTTVGQIIEASRRLKEAGIRTGFFLQFGYPGETRSDIDLTLGMLRECRPDDIGISVSYPLPGTPFYERVRRSLGGKRNWTVSEDLDLMFPGEFHPDFYRALHAVTHKRLRIWQGLDQARGMARAPWSATPARIRRVALSAYHLITLPYHQRKMHALEKPVQA